MNKKIALLLIICLSTIQPSYAWEWCWPSLTTSVKYIMAACATVLIGRAIYAKKPKKRTEVILPRTIELELPNLAYSIKNKTDRLKKKMANQLQQVINLRGCVAIDEVDTYKLQGLGDFIPEGAHFKSDIQRLCEEIDTHVGHVDQFYKTNSFTIRNLAGYIR